MQENTRMYVFEALLVYSWKYKQYNQLQTSGNYKSQTAQHSLVMHRNVK